MPAFLIVFGILFLVFSGFQGAIIGGVMVIAGLVVWSTRRTAQR